MLATKIDGADYLLEYRVVPNSSIPEKVILGEDLQNYAVIHLGVGQPVVEPSENDGPLVKSDEDEPEVLKGVVLKEKQEIRRMLEDLRSEKEEVAYMLKMLQLKKKETKRLQEKEERRQRELIQLQSVEVINDTLECSTQGSMVNEREEALKSQLESVAVKVSEEITTRESEGGLCTTQNSRVSNMTNVREVRAEDILFSRWNKNTKLRGSRKNHYTSLEEEAEPAARRRSKGAERQLKEEPENIIYKKGRLYRLRTRRKGSRRVRVKWKLTV